MELAMTFISILCGFGMICLGWHMWRHTMREILRDRLIDLRDEWRNYFVERGLDMGNPAYELLRGMLNGQLLNTRRLRFSGFFYIVSHMDAALREYCSARYAEAFTGCDDETRRKADSIRARASDAILLYIVSSSLAFILCIGYFITRLISKSLTRAVSRGMRNVFRVDDMVVECASGGLRPEPRAAICHSSPL